MQSQTGTGKTASYFVLMLQQLLTKEELAGKKALIMVPTRELAVQVEEEAKTLISGTILKTGSFYGGVGYEKQTALIGDLPQSKRLAVLKSFKEGTLNSAKK